MDIRRESRIGAALVAATLLAGPASAQNPGHTTLASVSTAGQQGDASSQQPSVSADGRYVAFASEATNLVPLDTNGNSDVFVYDALTGTTERVSITWQGQEARDDSDCPSISADGRYVAFRSRAWNMYSGGANLGNPIWQVYVHDRSGPSTVRVTVPVAGLDPDGEVGDCPSLSADASHVAYSSVATNMVEGDENGSADVFVKNLATGEVERPKYNPAAGEVYRKNTHPSLSGEGRVVAFESEASSTAPVVAVVDLETAGVTTLASPLTNRGQAPSISADARWVAYLGKETEGPVGNNPSVILHDLETGQRTLVSGERSSTDCIRDGVPVFCESGPSQPPIVSGDGRFVAFGRDSRRMLPVNPTRGTQLYLYDRVTGRLRRISVDPSSAPGESCSLEPGLSGDGRVLAYRSTSTNLVDLDANGPAADVFRSEWTCDDDGDCRQLSLCPATPAVCEAAERSTLRIRRRPPGGERRDRFHWRWTGAPEDEGTPFADPTAGARYQLCLYAESPERVEFDAGLPSGAGWKSRPTGYRLDGARDALSVVRLRKGGDRSGIEAKGAGSLLDLPYLPIAAPDGITVQMHESTTGRCWGAHFPVSAIAANFRGTPGAGPGQSGQLRADVR